MYEAHWGLKCNPFRDTADPAFYFAGESFEAALLKMRYVVENGLGAGLFVGEPGTGKTYLTRLLDERLTAGAGPVVRLDFPQMNAVEFLSMLAAELSTHVRFDSGTVSDRQLATLGFDATLRRVRRQLDGLAADGRHPVVVVDELHLVEDQQLLHMLHLLLNHQPRGQVEFSLIFAGTPAVLPRIERTQQLHDRIAVKGLIRRLDAHEVAAYVRHRLGAAGADSCPFDADALRGIAETSRGLPRRINRICDMALLVGFADRSTTIDAEVIAGVAEELIAVRAA